MKILILTIFLSVFAKQWHHRSFKSEKGYLINVDYQIDKVVHRSNKPYKYFYVTPIYVNVSGDLGLEDKISVEIVNYLKNQGACGEQKREWTEKIKANLQKANEGHYYKNVTRYGTKIINYPIYPAKYLSLKLRPYCREIDSMGASIRVEINGEKLMDPISLSSSFNFTF